MAKKFYIKNLQDLMDYFGADTPSQLNRRVYKATGCGASISVRKPNFKCDFCEGFEAKYRCSAQTHGECDCPKCQGFCECERKAWLHNGQRQGNLDAWDGLTAIDAFSVQTIVEGSDATVDSDTFVLPVKITDLNKWMEFMEDEADRLWKEANEECPNFDAGVACDCDYCVEQREGVSE